MCPSVVTCLSMKCFSQLARAITKRIPSPSHRNANCSHHSIFLQLPSNYTHLTLNKLNSSVTQYICVSDNDVERVRILSVTLHNVKWLLTCAVHNFTQDFEWFCCLFWFNFNVIVSFISHSSSLMYFVAVWKKKIMTWVISQFLAVT